MTNEGNAICVEEHETVWPELPELAFDDHMFDLWLPVYGLDACSEIRDILRAFAAEAAAQASWRVVRSGGIYRAVSPVPTAPPGRAFCAGVDDPEDSGSATYLTSHVRIYAWLRWRVGRSLPHEAPRRHICFSRGWRN